MCFCVVLCIELGLCGLYSKYSTVCQSLGFTVRYLPLAISMLVDLHHTQHCDMSFQLLSIGAFMLRDYRPGLHYPGSHAVLQEFECECTQISSISGYQLNTLKEIPVFSEVASYSANMWDVLFVLW